MLWSIIIIDSISRGIFSLSDAFWGLLHIRFGILGERIGWWWRRGRRWHWRFWNFWNFGSFSHVKDRIRGIVLMLILCCVLISSLPDLIVL